MKWVQCVLSIDKVILFTTFTGAKKNAPLVNPFADPQVWEKIENDPQTKNYLLDPEYRRIVEHLQRNPQDLG